MYLTQKHIDEMGEVLDSMLLSISLFEHIKLRLRYVGRTGDTHEWWIWNDNIARTITPNALVRDAYLFPEKYKRVSMCVSAITATMQGSIVMNVAQNRYWNTEEDRFITVNPSIRANGYDEFLEVIPRFYDALVKQESGRRMV